jgi:hypothetical protein
MAAIRERISFLLVRLSIARRRGSARRAQDDAVSAQARTITQLSDAITALPISLQSSGKQTFQEPCQLGVDGVKSNICVSRLDGVSAAALVFVRFADTVKGSASWTSINQTSEVDGRARWSLSGYRIERVASSLRRAAGRSAIAERRPAPGGWRSGNLETWRRAPRGSQVSSLPGCRGGQRAAPSARPPGGVPTAPRR